MISVVKKINEKIIKFFFLWRARIQKKSLVRVSKQVKKDNWRIRIVKIWNIFWGFLAAMGVLVGLIVGIYSLYDRVFGQKVEIPNIKEYIFKSKYYYVQVLTDSSNKVVAYGVTTRSKDFNPSLTLLEGSYTIDRDDPLNSSKYTSNSKIITLGKTHFAELGEPNNVFAHLGAHDFYYHEEFTYGNAGGYQSYFFAANESGYLAVDDDHLDFFLDHTHEKINTSLSDVTAFRQNSVINTFFVSAPFEAFDNVMLRKYLVGPDKYQIRVTAEVPQEEHLSYQDQYTKLKQLSTVVDIEYIITILGQPFIINDRPSFDIRTDAPYNVNLNPHKELKSDICLLLSIKAIFSKVPFYCLKLTVNTFFGNFIN